MSARVEFLAALKAGLRGAPKEAIDEIVADYANHFDEGADANRSEADVAAALGDPQALADELRTNLDIETFETSPSPRSAARVVAGVISLGVINGVLLYVALPLLAFAGLAGILSSLVFAAGGAWFLIAGSSLELPGGAGTTVLCGLGLIFAAISSAAVLILAGKAIVSAIGRYSQLRFRLLVRVPQPGVSR